MLSLASLPVSLETEQEQHTHVETTAHAAAAWGEERALFKEKERRYSRSQEKDRRRV